uniref:Uncharacterized protein n=1 Tax=Sphaerodactylus townsendi TaxID=933632 RepID=A0ACB8EKZ5_9SAUR
MELLRLPEVPVLHHGGQLHGGQHHGGQLQPPERLWLCKEINSHNFITSMNQIPTAGFEANVSSKTTDHFIYPDNAKNLPANKFLCLQSSGSAMGSKFSKCRVNWPDSIHQCAYDALPLCGQREGTYSILTRTCALAQFSNKVIVFYIPDKYFSCSSPPAMQVCQLHANMNQDEDLDQDSQINFGAKPH